MKAPCHFHVSVQKNNEIKKKSSPILHCKTPEQLNQDNAFFRDDCQPGISHPPTSYTFSSNRTKRNIANNCNSRDRVSHISASASSGSIMNFTNYTVTASQPPIEAHEIDKNDVPFGGSKPSRKSSPFIINNAIALDNQSEAFNKCESKVFNPAKTDPKSLKSLLSGVYFHLLKQEWRAVIGHGNRRQQKTFSVRKYGFEKAKYYAEYFRMQFELGSCSNDTRRKVDSKIKSEQSCGKAKQNTGSKRRKICKNDSTYPARIPEFNLQKNKVAVCHQMPSTPAAEDDLISTSSVSIENTRNHLKFCSNLSCGESLPQVILEQIFSYIFSGIELQQLLLESLSLPPLITWKPCQQSGIFRTCLSSAAEALDKKLIIKTNDLFKKSEKIPKTKEMLQEKLIKLASDLLLRICKDIAKNNLETNLSRTNKSNETKSNLLECQTIPLTPITEHFKNLDENLMQLRFSV